MGSSEIANRLTHDTYLPAAAQRAASNVATLRGLLATNTTGMVLDEDVWCELYHGHPQLDLDDLCRLTGRPLTGIELDAIVETAGQQKASVIAAAVAENDFGAERLGRLLTGKHAKTVAKALIGSSDRPARTIPDEHAERVARLLKGTHLAEYLATHPDVIDDDEATRLLTSFTAWRGPKLSRRRNRSLQAIIEHRPNLLPLFVTADADIAMISAAAGHRYLTDETRQHDLVTIAVTDDGTDIDRGRSLLYALLALANNPVAHRSTIETIAGLRELRWADAAQSAAARLARYSEVPTITTGYDQVDNPGVLSWLVRRSIPRTQPDGTPVAGKPYDVAALCANPHLNLDQARRLYEALGNYDIADQLGDDEISRHADMLIALHPSLAPVIYPNPGPDTDEDIDGPATAGPEWGERDVSTLGYYQLARNWLAARLTTEAEWRIAFSVVDGSTTQTLDDFVATIQAIA